MKYLALVLPMLLLGGCAQDYGSYTHAVKEQNVTAQIRIEAAERAKEERKMQHQENMMQFATAAMAAASASKNTADDVTVPLVLMIMEDKWAVAETMASANEKPMQMQRIEAPESVGDVIQKSTGALLGVASLGLSAYNSSTTADVLKTAVAAAGTKTYVSGENNSAVVDSNKSGSQNSVVSGGDSTINGDTVNDDSGSEDTDDESDEDDLGMCTGDRPTVPIVKVDDNGVSWINDFCSCSSYQAGHCDA